MWTVFTAFVQKSVTGHDCDFDYLLFVSESFGKQNGNISEYKITDQVGDGCQKHNGNNRVERRSGKREQKNDSDC